MNKHRTTFKTETKQINQTPKVVIRSISMLI